MQLFLKAALAASLLVAANGMYFRLQEGKRRCFLEEVPQDTLVVALYDNLDAINLAGSNDVVSDVDLHPHEPSRES